MGRPRCRVDAESASPPTRSDASAAVPRCADAPNTWDNQIVVNAPTASCVSTVMTTSGQCGCSGTTLVTSTGVALGGRVFGSVTRVVDRLPSPSGRPVFDRLLSIDSRHLATFTISIVIAPSGHAFTHAGVWPIERRPWHMSHLPTTPRSGLYCGTPYEQFHVQY